MQVTTTASYMHAQTRRQGGDSEKTVPTGLSKIQPFQVCTAKITRSWFRLAAIPKPGSYLAIKNVQDGTYHTPVPVTQAKTGGFERWISFECIETITVNSLNGTRTTVLSRCGRLLRCVSFSFVSSSSDPKVRVARTASGLSLVKSRSWAAGIPSATRGTEGLDAWTSFCC